MQFTKFSRTGLTVSRLCLATGTFGKQTDEAESFRIFEKAADAGVNFIDSADVYPGGADLPEVGRAEEITGRWLKGKRGRFILGTKAGGPIGSSPWDQGSSRKHLLDAIEASLRRLNTDYVDLCQLHMDDAATPLDETVEALDVIIRSGKARYIGVSNFLAYRLARAIGRQDTLRLARFVSVQPRYNLLFREIERELLPLAQEENLAVIPFNPLAGGLLSGKYRQDEKPEKGRFSADSVEELGFLLELTGAQDCGKLPSQAHPAIVRRVIGNSLASLRRFWAVAARRNSSLAPFGPLRRRRSSFRMRLRCAKSISTFLRSFLDVT
jgi:1-deoxyxylulose-5-phosphate synthase